MYAQISAVTTDACKAEPLVGMAAAGGTAGRRIHATGISNLSSCAGCITVLIPDLSVIPTPGWTHCRPVLSHIARLGS